MSPNALRLKPRTDHDTLQAKVAQARPLLQRDGDLQLIVLMRGHQREQLLQASQLMQSVLDQLRDIGTVTSGPTRVGRRIICQLIAK